MPDGSGRAPCRRDGSSQSQTRLNGELEAIKCQGDVFTIDQGLRLAEPQDLQSYGTAVFRHIHENAWRHLDGPIDRAFINL